MIKTPINKILFLDIETVGLEKNYDDLRANHPRIADQFDKYFDWFLKRFPEDKEIQEDQKMLFLQLEQHLYLSLPKLFVSVLHLF